MFLTAQYACIQYLLFSHVMLLFPLWEHEEGPHNRVFSVSTRLDQGPYVHKHTPITPSAQNQRFTQSRPRTGVTASVTTRAKTWVYPKDQAIILNSPRVRRNNAISSITPSSLSQLAFHHTEQCVTMACLHYRDVTRDAQQWMYRIPNPVCAVCDLSREHMHLIL